MSTKNTIATLFGTMFEMLAEEYNIAMSAGASVTAAAIRRISHELFSEGFSWNFAWPEMHCDQQLVDLGLAKEVAEGSGSWDSGYKYEPEEKGSKTAANPPLWLIDSCQQVAQHQDTTAT